MTMRNWAHVDAAGLVVATFCMEVAPAASVGLTVVELAAPLPARPDGFGWQYSIGDGAWVMSAPPSLLAALAEQDVRARRDRLLVQCDWTQGADSPLSATIKAAWATYRQALRDITLQPGWPLSVVWPEPPGNAG